MSSSEPSVSTRDTDEMTTVSHSSSLPTGIVFSTTSSGASATASTSSSTRVLLIAVSPFNSSTDVATSSMLTSPARCPTSSTAIIALDPATA